MVEVTLGDWIVDKYEKYIKPTKEEPTKETKVASRDKWSEELTKSGDDEKLTPVKRRELAHQSPIFMKGVKKKSMDSIRAWFKIITNNESNPIKMDIDALEAFEKRSNYKKKFSEAVTDAYIYGDGFILITFDDLDKDTPLSQPPAPGSEPRDATVICPEKITDAKYINERDKLLNKPSFVFKDTESSTGEVIHHDRIQHIILHKRSHDVFGLSTIDLLRNTIKSKKNVDIAVGRILAWFSHGILDIKLKNMNPDDEKKLRQIAKTHPTAWTHDEDEFEIDVIQPNAINPKPFMDFLILNIASALIMPVHVLTGIQVGKVTGAEIGFADYYRDIKDIQSLVYTPLIEDLYRKIIEARGRQWKYSLQWQTVYVDEMGEANLVKTRMEAAEIGLNTGAIDKKEARRMINEGLIELDENIEPPEEPDMPNKPERPDKPPQLPKDNQAMIDEWKRLKKKEIDELEEKVDGSRTDSED